MGSYNLSQCCESSEERSAGNLHATFCGNRRRVTPPVTRWVALRNVPLSRLTQCSRGPTVRTTPCQVIQGRLHLWIPARTALLKCPRRPPVQPRSLSSGLSADEEAGAGPCSNAYRTPSAARACADPLELPLVLGGPGIYLLEWRSCGALPSLSITSTFTPRSLSLISGYILARPSCVRLNGLTPTYRRK
jgi:hypothetical protein